jgi:hypothetical protein
MKALGRELPSHLQPWSSQSIPSQSIPSHPIDAITTLGRQTRTLPREKDKITLFVDFEFDNRIRRVRKKIEKRPREKGGI